MGRLLPMKMASRSMKLAGGIDMETYCGNCLFAQTVDNKTVCRHKKIGPNIARKYYRWFLTDSEKKALCPEFFKIRKVPPDSSIRNLLGPGAPRLKKIVSQAQAEKEQTKRADSIRQGALKL